MFPYAGKTALITGASSGIGAAFARALAARRMNLILVARSQAKLRALADELAGQQAIHTEVIAADLSREGAAQEILAQTDQRRRTVDLLINNAGFATFGAFDGLALDRELEEVRLNVAAVVALTRLFLPGMLARRAGGVINLASVVGFHPAPYMAVYGATKAFVLSFTEALWAECRGRGVRVLALCPGPVETPFFGTAKMEHEAAGGPKTFAGRKDTPEHVVAVGLRALERGRSYVIPRFTPYWLANVLPRLLPRSLVACLAEWILRPHKAPEERKPSP
jgi:uncharacterized protein